MEDSSQTMYTDQYEGFTGCTDRNPDYCACGTHSDPECEICGEVVESGQMMTTLIRPSYPLLSMDSDVQAWESHYAHADCRDKQATS